MKNDLEIYQAITGSIENIIFGIIFMLWLQIHLFTKNKTTAYDLICNTIFINKVFQCSCSLLSLLNKPNISVMI